MRPSLEQHAVVFVVDDEQGNLDLMVRTLGSHAQVHAFADPRVALASAERLRPSVVVTDFRMPNLNGVQLIQEIRKRGVTCTALLVTAFGDLEEVIRARDEKVVNRVISKPWHPADFRAQVELAIKLARLEVSVSELKDMNP
jgi:DNA-binding NtrC family response regulator